MWKRQIPAWILITLIVFLITLKSYFVFQKLNSIALLNLIRLNNLRVNHCTQWWAVPWFKWKGLRAVLSLTAKLKSILIVYFKFYKPCPQRCRDNRVQSWVYCNTGYSRCPIHWTTSLPEWIAASWLRSVYFKVLSIDSPNLLFQLVFYSTFFYIHTY